MRTIIIDRKKIIIACSVLTVSGIAAAAAFFLPSKAVTTFNEAPLYETILDEGLPNGESGGIKGFVKKILDFDLSDPKTIVEEYSAAFGDVQASGDEDTPAATETPVRTEEPVIEVTEEPKTQLAQNEPPFPTKEQISSSTGLSVNNATNYDVDIDSLCADELNFAIDNTGPQVLIVHTHTTECYNHDEMSGETERNVDESLNVCRIGQEIKSVLEENGISCIHDTTVHDYPSYQGAYTRTLSTISWYLENYPSIKMVLDVHRDAYIYSDGSKLTVTSDQNGVSTAQVMLVLGTDSMGLDHAGWRENLKLAAKIQNTASIMYPDLMRSINLRRERFNMHMTSGSLLLEIGSNGNTLDEAIAGGHAVARCIAAVLTQ